MCTYMYINLTGLSINVVLGDAILFSASISLNKLPAAKNSHVFSSEHLGG